MLTLDDVGKVFNQAARALRPGGLFLVDMNTPWFYQNVCANHTWFFEYEQVSVATTCHYDEQSGQNETVITGFIKRGELYERFVESHTQKGYGAEEISAAAEAQGLEVVAAYECFTFQPPQPESKRLVWVTRKPERS